MYACHTREIMLEALVAIPEHLYDDRGRLSITLAHNSLSSTFLRNCHERRQLLHEFDTHHI